MLEYVQRTSERSGGGRLLDVLRSDAAASVAAVLLLLAGVLLLLLHFFGDAVCLRRLDTRRDEGLVSGYVPIADGDDATHPA